MALHGGNRRLAGKTSHTITFLTVALWSWSAGIARGQDRTEPAPRETGGDAASLLERIERRTCGGRESRVANTRTMPAAVSGLPHRLSCFDSTSSRRRRRTYRAADWAR